MPAAFFDSNVILYSASSDPIKAERSDELIVRGGWASVQVLNEVANVSQRKMRHSWPRTHQMLGVLRSCLTITSLDVDVHKLGLIVAERYKLSIWDSMIVASALSASCDTLYTEDLHAGMVIDGRLRIVNPFR